MLADCRARWRGALDANLTVQIESKTYALVHAGRFALLDAEASETAGKLVDPFGGELPRDTQLVPAAARLRGVALRTVVAQGSYLNVDHGEPVFLNLRRCELEDGKVWTAARTADSDFLWFELSDAGV